GVFAPKRPTKETVLATLVIKGILAEIGAAIVGIICDGATTNRTMWNQLGISVYVFSDTPHLIKCTCNRLHNKKILKRHEKDSTENLFKSSDRMAKLKSKLDDLISVEDWNGEIMQFIKPTANRKRNGFSVQSIHSTSSTQV
uniref:Uncharacterized protein n=1 Tax=Strigamia maritima TaxID=126957 RepID=T1IJH9_STRMM